jgi:3-isopropylmalate/(R)-2-methylmalate dehydratase small subunit
MVNVDADFPKKAKAGDIVVGGRNFGCGVCHPHALMAFKGLGVNLVIAEQMARETIPVHALQEGLAMMQMPGVTAAVRTGDLIEVDLATGTLRNHTTGKSLQGRGLPAVYLERLEAGGLVPFLRKRMAEMGR